MKKQKENSHEGITWSEMGKQNIQAEKVYWNNASKRLFGSYSHSGIPGFPFRLFCSQEHNSWNIFRNIFLFRNIPNERAPNYPNRCIENKLTSIKLFYISIYTVLDFIGHLDI